MASDRPPAVEDFLDEPTRDLESWRWLWTGDHEFPIRSHRGFFGKLLVGVKRLLRPLAKTPQNDLWERQRVFNLILLEWLAAREAERHDDRIGHLEGFMGEGVADLMRHGDALFSRVDQKLDRHRREARDLHASLSSALALIEKGSPRSPEAAAAVLTRAREEHAYLELEQRFRGTEEEIVERLERYVPLLEGVAELGEVLDLGCGRGESLRVFRQAGIPARGIDASERMVDRCSEAGLSAKVGDLFETLATEGEASLAGVVSFHVIEHLPAVDLDRLVRLAFRALAPGGRLILETPNPLSLVAGSRNFWLDPTHQRPVHPRSLELLYELAGFSGVETVEMRPFPENERLPEIDLATLPEELHTLADRVNRLRDRLDALLYGAQDYAVVGTK